MEIFRFQFVVWPEVELMKIRLNAEEELMKIRLNAEEDIAKKPSEKLREDEHFSQCKDEFKIKFRVFVLFTFISLSLYMGDLSFDIYWLITFYIQGDYSYFCCTLAFLVIPAVIMIFRSLIMYNYGSMKQNENTHDPRNFLPKESKWSFEMKWLVGFVCPIPRYWNIIKYAYKTKQTKTKTDDGMKNLYFLAMIWEDFELTQLRQFDCFMESAPQLLLNLYIMIKGGSLFEVSPMIFPIFSVISLSLSLISYDLKISLMKAIKHNGENRQNQSNNTMNDMTNTVTNFIGNMNLKNIALLFAANFFWIVSRLIALSLFASFDCLLLWLACFLHLIPIFAWHWSENHYNFMDSFRLSFLHIFAYLHPLENESDRKKHPRFSPTMYKLTCFFENLFLMLQWSQSFIKEDGTLSHEILSVRAFFVLWIVQLAAMIASFILFWVVKKHSKCDSINFLKPVHI